MYEQFFQLNRKPFELVPNPEFLYPSRTHRKALNYLEYGIRERAGFVLLTGEVGAGKTTLIRDILNRLEHDIISARIFNTKVDSTQLLTLINEDFGLSVNNRQKIDLLRDLNEFLVEQYAHQRQPVLIIDEAQNLSVESLEEIRLLSNLEAADRKLLQIILVGQPELEPLIKKPELRQLRQRINISCHLAPLGKEEIQKYFYHRLERAGNASAVSLPEEAFENIHELTGGIPRLINIVGDYLLLALFADGEEKPSIKLVEEILEDIGRSVTFSESAPQQARTGGQDENSMHKRLTSLEAQVGTATAEEFSQGSLQERMLKHENVLKKIVLGQREQLANLHAELEKTAVRMSVIESKLDDVLKKGAKDVSSHKERAKILSAKLGG